MLEESEVRRFERAAEREIVSGQQREPLWPDLVESFGGDEKKAKAEYVRIRTDQLVTGETERLRQKKRRRKKRSYHDSNSVKPSTFRYAIYASIILGILGVILFIVVVRHAAEK